jgi:hypothetical protein
VALLKVARQCLLPYDGKWKADWLLSDIHDDMWRLRTSATRKVAGEWKGTVNYYWTATLPDGSALNEPGHRMFRETAQKAAFLVRFLPEFGIDSTNSFHEFLSDLTSIIQWLYANDKIYSPDTDLFLNVDEQAINAFMHAVANGGKPVLLQIQQRCLSYFINQALPGKRKRSVRANDLEPQEINAICAWLRANDFYTRRHRNRTSEFDYIDRQKLARAINCGWQELKSDRVCAFLRKFEPDFLAASSVLLLPVNGTTSEYPGQWTQRIDEVREGKASYTTANGALNAWRTLLRLRRHLPKAIPNLESMDWSLARRLVLQCEQPKHTPWVPLNIALSYTTESLRIVVGWAEPLVQFYLRCVDHFQRKDLFNRKSDTPAANARNRAARDAWVNDHLPAQLKEMGVCGWTTIYAQATKDVPSRLRNSPGVSDLIEVMVGAIAVLIGITKPMRMKEFLGLRRKCISFAKGDGYWLEHEVRKLIFNDRLIEAKRPIPAITARAITILGKLGDGLANRFPGDDEYATSRLLYLPVFGRTGTVTARAIEEVALHECLDAFCDFVNLPVDELGRRWYIRNHELRKSFLLTFFWCFKYASLDAARWMAGHSDSSHLYRYIEANFPGDELPRIEAEYAAMQLLSYGSSGKAGEATNVQALYRDVCKHFGVSSIDLIESKELSDWLELAFFKGTYSIEPFVIESKDKLVKVEVAFRVREKARRENGEESKRHRKRS